MTTTEAGARRVPSGGAWYSRVPAWTGDLLAIVVVLVSSFMGGPMGPGDRGAAGPAGPTGPTGPGGPTALERPVLLVVVPIVAVLVACALIPLRRRWSSAVLVAGIALYGATVLSHEPSMGVGIVVILAAYSFGARHSRRPTLVVGLVTTVFFVVMSLLSSEFGVIDVRVFQIAAGIAVAFALGDSSRSHRESAAAATERAERAEQSREAEAQRRVAEERLRIAQDLHDTVAHQISVISLNAGAASRALTANPEKARKALLTIRSSSREVLSEIGNLLSYLRADGEAVAAAPQPSAAEIPALVARVREAGLNVTFIEAGDWARASGASGRVLYRIVQEGLTNAHKHGSQRRATLRVTVDGEEIHVSITNPVSETARNLPDPVPGGLGLTGIRERVAAIGGSVETSIGDQFRIQARLPFTREEGA